MVSSIKKERLTGCNSFIMLIILSAISFSFVISITKTSICFITNYNHIFSKITYNKFDNNKNFCYIIVVVLTCEGLKLGSRMRVDMQLHI